MTKYIIAVAVGAILASFSSQAATKFKDSSVLSSGLKSKSAKPVSMKSPANS